MLVEEFDDGALVIGDNPTVKGEIAIRIIGGTILSTANGEFIEDPLGNQVEIDRNKDHWIGKEDHPNSLEPVRKAIRNPDEIWENGNNRMYVKQLNGKWLVVRVFSLNGVWGVSTAVYEGSSYERVNDLLNRKGYRVPEDKIYG